MVESSLTNHEAKRKIPMRKRFLALPVLAAGLGLLGGTPAMAYGTNHGTGHGTAGTAGTAAAVQPAANVQSADKATGKSAFFLAKLSGDQEVPTPGGPAVGDRDGKAVALVKIRGNRVTFAFTSKGIEAPTLGHIHQGKAGANGPVKVNLFTEALPDSAQAAAGRTTVDDAAVLKAIKTDPSGFYVNLHTKTFGGGAVRGQLVKLNRPVDVLGLLKGGGFRAFADADQEVQKPGGPKVGDPDGFASAFIRPRANRLDYAIAWVGITAPTKLHIHQGKFGVNGEVKIDLANVKVPDTIFALAGTAKADPQVTRAIRQQPKGFYLNIHTAEFTDGAVRGQLLR
jgi:hypothetical protein